MYSEKGLGSQSSSFERGILNIYKIVDEKLAKI